MVLLVVLSVFLVSSVRGRIEYLQRIPNAYSVKTEVSSFSSEKITKYSLPLFCPLYINVGNQFFLTRMGLCLFDFIFIKNKPRTQKWHLSVTTHLAYPEQDIEGIEK